MRKKNPRMDADRTDSQNRLRKSASYPDKPSAALALFDRVAAILEQARGNVDTQLPAAPNETVTVNIKITG
jgi:hypothetical protein